ncbi:DUF397 domain-containing protein [Streptomyces sp. DT2A-34]|uniref:DUF397 domain-containing protein n=1 Tax=Streptomyces sp. DT2A-34 TaxID=3051182 RepID=UPI00265C65E7|nr:DUF397 domain-containing protein [Streptomyces sp. DT2A-34]MDO0912011.1 DUF397 domain-containing protein [Streptomyces sp. DT2A-34]
MTGLRRQKSTYSEGGADTCGEVALDDTATVHHARATPPASPSWSATSAFATLLDGIKGGAMAGR